MNFLRRKFEWLAGKLYYMVKSLKSNDEEPPQEMGQQRSRSGKNETTGPASAPAPGLGTPTCAADCADLEDFPPLHRCSKRVCPGDALVTIKTNSDYQLAQSSFESTDHFGNFQRRLASTQCAHCKTPVRVTVSRTKRMLEDLGTGYGPDFLEQSPQIRPASPEDTKDAELYFRALSSVLSSRAKSNKSRCLSSFGSQPHQVVSVMMQRSPMLHHADEILRHTAIEEISPRHAIRICALTAQMQTIAEKAGVLAADAISKSEQSAPCPLTQPFHAFNRVLRAKTPRGSDLEDIARKSAAWHRENCVKELPDELILDSHYYAPFAKDIESGSVGKGRMIKLVAQICSLSSDLPEGIFVRYGESRPDVIKALIIGPTGTPYEHGLFEFDMFCTKDFPQAPPRVFFRTTGGIRFNPNLYNTGKVCLSLLGTWSGTPWDPKASTILQILVSIQSMIFNEKPYYNEPGYETKPNDARCEAYNREIEPHTVRVAMKEWLTYRLARLEGVNSTFKEFYASSTIASSLASSSNSSINLHKITVAAPPAQQQ
ncbi:hypothetical protein N0V88_002112 [Collariella sp. IMI 366227]|nr:hypothetical protein N0V88_002112 [Collariella sp. IMI 366227]